MTVNQLREKAVNKLPLFTFILFVMQPFMDILSFWLQKLEMTTLPSLLLRFGVLGVTALLGFLFSRRKRLYLIFAAVCALVWTGHIVSCLQVGYINPITDITNYVRVLQMPLFVFCLISFFKANQKCVKAMENGLLTAFGVITVSVILARVTGTDPQTYQNIGVLGWFATTNAQSSVISLLSPIVIGLAYRKKNIWFFAVTVVASFAQLYFFGTRLAFFAMLITAVGMVVTMILARDFRLSYAGILLVCALIAVGTVKLSPMYIHQNQYTEIMGEKQNDAVCMIQKAEEEKKAEGDPTEQTPLTQEEKLEALSVIYEFYTPDMCKRFGVERVMKAYDYTQVLTDITAVRKMKIMFCSMVMEESPVLSRVFGLELDRMTYDDFVYDVENDFHGIFFLYGYVGLALMIAFLGYFVFLILRCLIKDFNRFFTLEAGIFGIALILGLINAYFTAGVLRRPNSSFYLSAVLAMVYYLIQLRDYDTEEPRPVLFEKKKKESK